MGSFSAEKTNQEVLPYDSIGGPTYVTAQTLIQQVSYALSDKLFTYSPETFDLDTAVKQWASAGEKNVNGYTTSVQPMQTRQGAGTIALGYIFSQDFDLKKRHIPQTIIASSATLQYLRPALEQLTLLYSVANPLVGHVSAVDYKGGSAGHLVADYHTALRLSEELGLGLVATASTHEAQHMAFFSTLLAKVLPTLHIYDGIKIGRENTRVIDVFTQSRLSSLTKVIYEALEGPAQKHLDDEGKLLGLLQAFNDELGTDYKPFEYHGHADATSVLVTFGTVESSLTAQIADALALAGVKIGVVNVRVYRPFVEEEFLKALPASAQTVGVLGQVPTELDVEDESVHSPLYEDVLATVLFGKVESAPECVELKYSTSTIWTPETILNAFQSVAADVLPVITRLLDDSTQQYTFWDVDDSVSSAASAALSKALAKNAATNVTTNTSYDNLVLGGVVRTDIRKSAITLDAPYAINAADAAYVGSTKILSEIDVLASVKENGTLLVNAPGVKEDELEQKLPATFRKALSDRKVSLYLLDTFSIEDDAVFNSTIQTSFVHAALGLVGDDITALLGNDATVSSAAANRENVLHKIDVPESWAPSEEESAEEGATKLPSDITPTSFVPFDKTEEEAPARLEDWQSVAKSLVFREAYDTKAALRPDLSVKTHTIHVSANKRLTPGSYERNIFHIEFDLGDSGLTYDIGEALGIHAENDSEQIEEFINFYGPDPEAIVPVPSREDQAV
ncbi:RHO1 GDP-GTP exchange protein 2, partial [Ascosphaera pollenicola]